MTQKHTSEDPAVLTPVEARGGVKVKGMPFVLGVSLGMAVLVLGVVFVMFAA